MKIRGQNTLKDPFRSIGVCTGALGAQLHRANA